jgi:tetratricopeptide (TPR) repeat protein
MKASGRGIIAVLLWIAAAGVHVGALRCGFIAYDDGPYVYENPHLRHGFTAESIRWALTAHLTHDALPNLDYWQPVTVFSRLLDVELYGLDPRGHHATNVLLHGLNAALLFLVLDAMTAARWRSAFAAALWAVHPLRVESVVWVTERKDVLSGLFWMLTMAAYVRYARRGRRADYALLVALFALGLMAKPVLVTLPFVLLLLDYWPLARVGPGRWDALRRLVAEKLPLLALSAASLAITVISHARWDFFHAMESRPASARVAGVIVEYARSAWRFAWPPPMALPQPYPPPRSAWEIAACAGVILAVSSLALAQARRRPSLGVGWFWFLGTLLPAISLVQSAGQPLADRFAYIPHVGLSIAVVWGIAELVAAFPARERWAVPAALAALVVFGTMTVRQTRYWRDSETLFRHSASVTSGNYAAHFNLANALAAQRRVPEARAEYEATLAINPRYAAAHGNLANLLAASGRGEDAAAHYLEALRIAPDFADAHANLGLLLAARNDRAEARRHYQEALRLRPAQADTHYNLGRLDLAEGRLDDALREFGAAVEADPALARAYTARANILARAGRFADAETEYRSALRVDPADADARNNLGRVLSLQGRADEAMAEYEEAARRAPGHPLVQLNIGRLLLAAGRPAEALARYETAVRLDPRSADAHLERGLALAGLGRGAESCAEYREALRLDPALAEAREAMRASECGAGPASPRGPASTGGPASRR